MAGELVLRQGRKVGLITVDTYRVGADQLQAYVDLLDVLCGGAYPAELAQAVERMHDCDNILVDTAGRSPSDAARVHELKGFAVQYLAWPFSPSRYCRPCRICR